MLTDKTSRSMVMIACAFLIYFVSHAKDSRDPQPPMDKKTMNEMAGTWTDPKGPKGNHIIFKYTKIKDEPGDILGGLVAAYDKDGELNDIFGFKETPFSFGYKSHAPDVVLFVNYGERKQMIMKLTATDHEHMRIRMLSRNLATQKEDLSTNPINEPPVDLVREKEADVNLPKYQ